MISKNTTELTIEVKAHVEADAVVQGQYWQEGKGCFIGCLTHEQYGGTSLLLEAYGLPKGLVLLCEEIFENLPTESAKEFFASFPAAIAGDGKYLNNVVMDFIIADIREQKETLTEEGKALADQFLSIFERMRDGDALRKKEVQDAIRTWEGLEDADASYALEGAMGAVEFGYRGMEGTFEGVDYVSEYSDDKRVIELRDLLLKTIKEAPMTAKVEGEKA